MRYDLTATACRELSRYDRARALHVARFFFAHSLEFKPATLVCAPSLRGLILVCDTGMSTLHLFNSSFMFTF